ncbi:MAG: hypothetical protein ACTSU5_21745 [Promethearchaeota archaeon]
MSAVENPKLWTDPHLYEAVKERWNEGPAAKYPRADVILTAFVRPERKRGLEDSVNVDFVFRGGVVDPTLTLGLIHPEKPPYSVVVEGSLKRWGLAAAGQTLKPLKVHWKFPGKSDAREEVEKMVGEFFEEFFSVVWGGDFTGHAPEAYSL